MPRLQTAIDIGPSRFAHRSYDAVSDVAYLSVGEPKEAITWESPEGHRVRLDPDTEELVGVTILYAGERSEAGGPTITFPESVSAPSSRSEESVRMPVRVSREVLKFCLT